MYVCGGRGSWEGADQGRGEEAGILILILLQERNKHLLGHCCILFILFNPNHHFAMWYGYSYLKNEEAEAWKG